MSPVFGHGRLRLYLLKLLDEAPRHGYEIIRLLQDRFLGVYAPSPGTVYPRLSRLEKEGLVTHDETGGRKVYRLTDEGREELHQRLDELEELEREITDSARDIAREVTEDVRETVRSLREELKHAAQDVRRQSRDEADDAFREQQRARRQAWREQKEAQKRAWREQREAQKQAWREQKEAQRQAWRESFRDAPRDWADRTEWAQRWGEPWTPGRTPDPRAVLERLLNDFRGEVRDELRRAVADRRLDTDAVLACREVLDEAARRLRAVLREGPDER